jgi:prepilin-type N-terminal cleavage/methylation domain-containing protein
MRCLLKGKFKLFREQKGFTILEVLIALGIFSKIGVEREEYVTNYTWNTGAVVVPHYDSQADAGESIINANFGLIPGGIGIISWQIE